MPDPARPRVFVARRIPAQGLDAILDACDADVWDDELPPPRDELLRRVAGVDGILALLTDRVDDELLDAAGPGLRVVSNYGVGYDNIDVPACTRRGIPVGNTPGVLTETTADLAWALLLAAARRVVEGDRSVRDGHWRTWGPMLLLGVDVHGATLGIVGFGRIGQAVARRAAGFGMRVLYHARHRVPEDVERATGATWLPLPELLAASDFVSLHVSLSAETRHLIDAAALGSMRRVGDPRQHGAWPGRRHRRARRRPARRHDPRRRARRHRPGAAARGPPARRPRQLHRRAPHRVRDGGDAGPDGRDVGRESPRRRARGAPAHAREPRGLRPQRVAARPAAGPSSTRTRDGCDLTPGGT